MNRIGGPPEVVTLTANPSLDRTMELPTALRSGSVQRAVSVRAEAGGKGINVSRVVAAAGVSTRAVLPAGHDDPLIRMLDSAGLDHVALTIDSDVRSNLTLVDPDGTTTKINAPGSRLTAPKADRLAELVIANADGARWVALCGSLPPGLPDDWYRMVMDALTSRGCRVALDTSGAPLAAATVGRVDLLKPNDEELAQAVGADPVEFAAAATRRDFGPLIDAAHIVVDRTGASVLATLGAAGALLVTATGEWFATAPPVTPRSTVGAGDASLAGYLIAECRGAPEPERLRLAVAYGSAAAGLPGTQPPTPEDLNPDGAHITDLTTIPKEPR